MPDISHINIRATIDHLRPGGRYHWKGDGSFGNQYDAVGDWRDPETSKPTEQEIIDAWPTVEASLSTESQSLKAAGRLCQEVAMEVIVRSLADIKRILAAGNKKAVAAIVHRHAQDVWKERMQER